MAQSVGEPVNSQIIQEQALGCPFIFIMCEVGGCKVSFLFILAVTRQKNMSCGQMPLDGGQQLVSVLPVPSPTRASLLHRARRSPCPPLPPLLP